MLAVQQRNQAAVELLLAYGAHAPTPSTWATSTLVEALKDAPSFAIATALIKAGEDLDVVDEGFSTLLHLAVRDTDAPTVKFLLAVSLLPEIVSPGVTPHRFVFEPCCTACMSFRGQCLVNPTKHIRR